MKKYKLVLLVLLLFLGIGFASVSTTLTIDAGAELSKNSEDFDVKFTKATLDGVDITSTAISNDGLEISFGTRELLTSGDKSVLTYIVKNNSTMYDVTVSINCVSNDEHSSLYTVNNKIESIITAKTTKSGIITVTLNSTQESAIQGALTCTLSKTPIERNIIEEHGIKNSNIVKVMEYNESTCITGEESTCVELDKYADSTYDIGTIVKYKVNKETTRTFYVLHDDGDKLTLQDRENIVDNTPWNTSGNNSDGPTTILPTLQNSTSSWSNVNTLNYTLRDNTGCNPYNVCNTNAYDLGYQNGKARLITNQEVVDAGCTDSNISCPKWMYNYLAMNGMTSGISYGYWTSSSLIDYYAGDINFYGQTGIYGIRDVYRGARAVVEINK